MTPVQPRPRPDVFPGSSEMARLMGQHDWGETPLGPTEHWPEGLRIALDMLLSSKFEMWLGWGPELHFFYNDSYAPTMGIRHPAMLGRPFKEVWAEVYDDVADQVEKVRAGESTWNEAMPLILERSGYPEETYHSFSYSPLYDADGSVGGMLCVVSEETERVVNQRRLETLQDLGSALVGVSDHEGARAAIRAALNANRRDFPFALFYLYGEEGLTGYSCSDDAAYLVERDWALDLTGEGHSFPLEGAYYPTGEWDRSPTEAISIAIPGPSDAVFGSLVLALNPYRRDTEDALSFARLIAGRISGALANVAALNSERQRAEMIWTYARDLMVVADEDGLFHSVSPAWTRILGHPVDEIIGHHFSEFVEPEDIVSTDGALAEAFGGVDLTGYENRFRTRDGQIRWISWHTSKVGDLVFAYGRDITEQKANAEALLVAEDALRQAQKMEAIGQLTGGIAHDFNNLLMAISSSLTLLRKRTPDDPQALKWIDSALEGTQRGAALTQRMLAFARRQDLQPEPIDLRQILGNMSELLEHTLGPGWPLDLRLPPHLPLVVADGNQLEMAIVNLAVNARDAMPQCGTITITAEPQRVLTGEIADLAAGDYIKLSVIDHGTGMDDATRQRATEPFFTTKGIGKGTGLGLSMIHGLAQQLGGTFTLSSILGQGTTATLWLPSTDAQSPSDDDEAGIADPAPHAIDTRPAQLKVLAVDDDVLILMNTAALLEDLGHHVLEATSGADAIDLLAQHPDIDLLITDQAMPNMTGTELVDRISDSYPALPIIVATGYGEIPATARLRVRKLSKPFTQAQLAQAIAEALND